MVMLLKSRCIICGDVSQHCSWSPIIRMHVEPDRRVVESYLAVHTAADGASLFHTDLGGLLGKGNPQAMNVGALSQVGCQRGLIGVPLGYTIHFFAVVQGAGLCWDKHPLGVSSLQKQPVILQEPVEVLQGRVFSMSRGIAVDAGQAFALLNLLHAQ